jgi:hypothetical protein
VAFSDTSMNTGTEVTNIPEDEYAWNIVEASHRNAQNTMEVPSSSSSSSSILPSENANDLSTQPQEILPDSLNSNNSNIMRELYSSLLNRTDDLDQSAFNNVFQNILMESTDAPPNISNVDLAIIPNIRPLIMSLLQNSSSSSIESIDITYTVDYDVSNN